jgi:chloramphenicol O-acetyltransferase type A
MAEYLDLTTWARREVFEFFRGFDNPYFNVCTRVDVSRLLAALNERSNRGLSSDEALPAKANVSLAYHYFALKAANEIEPFRYRLRDGKVLVHSVIHGATTVLLPNETFTFAYFDYVEDFGKFIAGAERAVEEAKAAGGFRTRDDDDDMIHCTVLPWVSFTSFSHARNWSREDSVPKISFGKFVRENERTLMPISVEVHHALMDGLHVGRYLTRLEEMLAEAERYVRAKNP